SRNDGALIPTDLDPLKTTVTRVPVVSLCRTPHRPPRSVCKQSEASRIAHGLTRSSDSVQSPGEILFPRQPNSSRTSNAPFPKSYGLRRGYRRALKPARRHSWHEWQTQHREGKAPNRGRTYPPAHSRVRHRWGLLQSLVQSTEWPAERCLR